MVRACIFYVLGVSEFFVSLEEDGGAAINGDGCTIFRGFGCVDLGVFLLEVVDLGVMVFYENGEIDGLNVSRDKKDDVRF